MEEHLEMQNSKKMRPHWEKWMSDLSKSGGDSYFLSFMFHELPGSERAKLAIMAESTNHFL